MGLLLTCFYGSGEVGSSKVGFFGGEFFVGWVCLKVCCGGVGLSGKGLYLVRLSLGEFVVG